jgi:molybdate transport repressor ModE-like protein
MARLVRAPELTELDTLIACAADGSLAAAARRLGISRPAVAKRIEQLEAISGLRLLEREAHGVRLTDAGVALAERARRLLAERDALVDAILELRASGGASRTSGMRALVGATTPAARAAQRPEAVLVAAERLFELVFHASATAIVISDPADAVVHEVNDAFCEFIGRRHDEVIGRNAVELGAWYSLSDRERLVGEVRRHGAARDVTIRVMHPDGAVRIGVANSQLVELADRPQLLTTIQDVTAEADHAAAAAVGRAVARLAVDTLRGVRTAAELETGALEAMLRGERFAVAAVFEPDGGIVAQGGGRIPDGLPARLAHAPAVASADGVVRSGATTLAARLSDDGRWLAAVAATPLSERADSLFAPLVGELARLLGTRAPSSPRGRPR